MEGDPLQGEEGFEAFDLRWLTSSNSGESYAALTMQGKFSSSSTTGPGKKQSLCCPPLECDNEGLRGRGERGTAALGSRPEDQPPSSSDLSGEFKADFRCELEFTQLKSHVMSEYNVGKKFTLKQTFPTSTCDQNPCIHYASINMH